MPAATLAQIRAKQPGFTSTYAVTGANIGTYWRDASFQGVIPPSAGELLTRALYPGGYYGTLGIMLPRPATAGKKNYLTRAEAWCNLAHPLMIIDRLYHKSGLDGTLATAQAIANGAYPRADANLLNGVGVMLAVVRFAAVGATQVNVQASYTNELGVAGRTTPAVPFFVASNVNYEMRILPWQSGDMGIRSVQSVTLSATTGTAGNFGVVLFKPICSFTLPPTNPVTYDALALGMPVVDDDAVWMLLHDNVSSSSGSLHLQFGFTEL